MDSIVTTSTSASTISAPEQKLGAASLAGILFDSVGFDAVLTQMPTEFATIVPPSGSKILCSHCNRQSLSILNDCIVVIHRHGSDYHKTVMPLADLGYFRRE